MLPTRYRQPIGSARQQRKVDGSPKDQTWPGTSMALGIFLWLLAFWFLASRTLITYIELFRWFALFAFIGNLLPFRKSGLALGMERGEWFFFNLLTVGPVLFTLSLGVNMLFHGKEQVFLVPQAANMSVHRYWIENDALPPMTPNTRDGALGRHDMIIGLAPGGLGYDVITFQRVPE